MSEEAHKHTQLLVSSPRGCRGFLLGAPLLAQSSLVLTEQAQLYAQDGTAPKRCFIKKFFPSLYSYPHLSAAGELRAPRISQEPSAHKLQHKIMESTFLAGSSPSPHPISKLLALRGQWEKINNEINLWEEEMSEEKQQSRAKSLLTTGLLAAEIVKHSWEEKCHCTITQSSSASFRGIQMPGHPTESPNK